MTRVFEYTKIRFTILSSIFFSLTVNAQKLSIKKQFIFPLQTEHVHSSSLVALPNGALMACWFQGSGERKANDVKIMGARLEKGEDQWGEPFVMADTPGLPDCNPVLFLNQRKELFLFWIVVQANQWEKSILKYKRATVYEGPGPPTWEWQDLILLQPGEAFQEVTLQKFKALPDRGLSWAEYAPPYEKMIVEAAGHKTKRQTGWMTRTQPLQLSSGRILLPLYSDGYNFSLIAHSDDYGYTWQSGEPLVGYGNVQPSLIEKQKGEVVAYMRDNGDRPGRVMQSFSLDQGATWSPVKDGEMANPGASLHVLKLTNGTWLMVNNNQEEGRNTLHLNQSTDEGKTWRPLFPIENSDQQKDSFSYPSLIQTPSDAIHLSYSYRKGGKKTIVHAQLSL